MHPPSCAVDPLFPAPELLVVLHRDLDPVRDALPLKVCISWRGGMCVRAELVVAVMLVVLHRDLDPVRDGLPR